MKTKYLIPCLLLLCVAAPGQESPKPRKSNLTITYDKIEDRTNISTSMKGVKGAGLYVQAYMNHSGEVLTKPITHVGLIFYSTSRNWKYSGDYDRQLFVLADGERWKFDSPSRKAEINSARLPYSRVTVSERLIFAIASEELDRILRSNKIEMKLGQETFSLDDRTLTALREITARSRP